jgi:hypothetical protein
MGSLSVDKYTELDRKQRQIRLIRLHAGSSDDSLCCYLETVSLDTKLEYEALSYVWATQGYFNR